MRSLRFATVVLLAACPLLLADEPPELPLNVASMSLSGTTVRLAKDLDGQILTYEPRYQRMTVWKKDGKREKSCTFLPTQLMGPLGVVGFSEGRALLTFHDEPAERALVIDLSRCEAKERNDIKGVMAVEVFPAPGGWMLSGPVLADRRYSLLRLDLAGKLIDTFTVPDEIRDDIRARVPGLPFERAIAIWAGRDVWILPSGSYGFIRPPQRGKGEYSFDPPACLASEAREIKGEAQIRFLEKRVEGSATPEGAAMNEKALEAAKKGVQRTFLSAVGTAAGFGDLLGVLVGYDRGGRRGCRLDVWDMTAEAVVAVVPVGEECGGFLALSDEGAWVASGGKLRSISLPSLSFPLKQPCVVLRDVVRATGSPSDLPKK